MNKAVEVAEATTWMICSISSSAEEAVLVVMEEDSTLITTTMVMVMALKRRLQLKTCLKIQT